MNSLLARDTLFLLATAWSFAGLAQQVTLDGDLVAENAWTRATDNRTAAIYLARRNGGQTTVDLIGVRTDRASIETPHKTETDSNGAAKMSAPLEPRIKPGAAVVLEPGGTHVMLIDLKTAPRSMSLSNSPRSSQTPRHSGQWSISTPAVPKWSAAPCKPSIAWMSPFPAFVRTRARVS